MEIRSLGERIDKRAKAVEDLLVKMDQKFAERDEQLQSYLKNQLPKDLVKAVQARFTIEGVKDLMAEDVEGIVNEQILPLSNKLDTMAQMMSDLAAQSATATTGMMEAIRSGVQGGNNNNNIIINENGIARERWWSTWEGQRSIPPGYKLVTEPRPGIFFGLWFCGSRQDLVRPYCFVQDSEWDEKKDQYVFSKAKQVMKYFATLIKGDKLQRDPDVSQDVKQSCNIILSSFRSTQEVEDDKNHTKLFKSMSDFLLGNPLKEESLYQALYSTALCELQIDVREAAAIKSITTLYKKISAKRQRDTGRLRKESSRRPNQNSRKGQKPLFASKRPRALTCGCNRGVECSGLRMPSGYSEREVCTKCSIECWAICVDENEVCHGCKSGLDDID